MGTFVTGSGFVRKSFQAIRQDIVEKLKAKFGDDFDVSPDTPNGLLIDVFAKQLDDCYQMGQDVYDVLTPAGSYGESLDKLLPFAGLTRKSPTKMHGRVMLYTDSTDAVTVPVGTAVIRTRGNVRLKSVESITIGMNAVKDLTLVCAADGSVSGSFSFSFGTYNVSGSSVKVALDDLCRKMANVNGVSVARLDDDTVRICSENEFSITSLPNWIDDGRLGNDGEFVADDAGPETAAVGEVNALETQIEGITDVYNVNALVDGTDTETDAELRQRFIAYNRSAKEVATDQAIEVHILNTVEGATYAKVTSNRTMVESETGIPPKSFEAVVKGGLDADVAKAIYETMSAGIQPHGSTEVIVTEDDGQEQLIRFSRPVAKYLWIAIICQRYKEENVSATVEDDIRNAVMGWAEKEYTLGKDVIPGRIMAAVYTNVPGFMSVAVTVGIADNASDPMPTMSAISKTIKANEYAVASTERMIVRVL